jgi:hypothetical protein
MMNFVLSAAWGSMLLLIFAFGLVFAAKLDWRHYPSLGVVALLLLAAPACDGVFGLKPFNLPTLLSLMLAGAIFVVWYLVKQFRAPPAVPVERRASRMCEIDAGDMTRTIKSVERKEIANV